MVPLGGARPPAHEADAAGQDTTDLDELLTELDEEITKAGMRGKAAPARRPSWAGEGPTRSGTCCRPPSGWWCGWTVTSPGPC